jgi:hypothetical protein
MIGATTRGTPPTVSRLSLRLVVNSITSPPTSSSALRRAMDRLEPITFSIWVVSAVRREITSPVRPASNHAGGRVSRWSKTRRRMSAVTRSPSHDTL